MATDERRRKKLAIEDMALADLDTDARSLFQQLSAIECGCRLVRFFEKSANTLRTVDDVAYHLVEPHAVIAKGLDALVGLGLVRRVEAAGLALFGFTKNHETRLIVRELCEWHDHWHACASVIERLLDGKAGDANGKHPCAGQRTAPVQGRDNR